METVPETYLADYKVETDAEKGTVTVTPFLKGKVRSANVTVCAYSCGKPVSKGTLGADSDSVTLTLPKPLRLWSCETPNLYGLKITIVAGGCTDLAKGYFGIRTVGTKLDAKGIRRATVNGEFTYFLATLDQGWWPDGYLTPPSEDALRFDVDFHKKAGFNAIRKHIKVEPRAFYAHCDRIGVWCCRTSPRAVPTRTRAIDQFWEGGGFVTFDREIVKFDYEFLRSLHKEILVAARDGAAGR